MLIHKYEDGGRFTISFINSDSEVMIRKVGSHFISMNSIIITNKLVI